MHCGDWMMKSGCSAQPCHAKNDICFYVIYEVSPQEAPTMLLRGQQCSSPPLLWIRIILSTLPPQLHFNMLWKWCCLSDSLVRFVIIATTVSFRGIPEWIWMREISLQFRWKRRSRWRSFDRKRKELWNRYHLRFPHREVDCKSKWELRHSFGWVLSFPQREIFENPGDGNAAFTGKEKKKKKKEKKREKRVKPYKSCNIPLEGRFGSY